MLNSDRGWKLYKKIIKKIFIKEKFKTVLVQDVFELIYQKSAP